MRLQITFSLLMLTGSLIGQTNFERTKSKLSGDMMTFGFHRTYFLNSRFQSYLEDGVINPNLGFLFEYQFVFYPFSISLGYFSSGYKIKGYTNWQYEDDTRVQHRGLELATNLYLFPDTYSFNPYIGVGYQSASLGVGIEVLKAEGEKQNAISSIDLSQGIGKFGLLMSFRWVSIKAEFKRAFQAEGFKFNNQFSVGIAFRQLYSKRTI